VSNTVVSEQCVEDVCSSTRAKPVKAGDAKPVPDLGIILGGSNGCRRE
jgi:hypothetical protein